MRDGIVDLHRGGGVTKSGLDAIINAQSHLQKLKLYPVAADGYLRFLGRPAAGLPRAAPGHVALGRPRCAGQPGGRPADRRRGHVIELYFKQEELTKPKVQATIGVMVAELGSRADPGRSSGFSTSRTGSCCSRTAAGMQLTPRFRSEGRRGHSARSGRRSDSSAVPGASTPSVGVVRSRPTGV